MSVFSPLHEQTVHLRDCTEEKRRIKRFCLWLGKRVGERALGWSSLTPAALGARRGQHTIAVGRTGTWPCATRKFRSLTCCSSVCVLAQLTRLFALCGVDGESDPCVRRKAKYFGAKNRVTCTRYWVSRPLWQWYCSGGKKFWCCVWPDVHCGVCHIPAVSDLHQRDLGVRDQMTGSTTQ